MKITPKMLWRYVSLFWSYYKHMRPKFSRKESIKKAFNYAKLALVWPK